MLAALPHELVMDTRLKRWFLPASGSFCQFSAVLAKMLFAWLLRFFSWLMPLVVARSASPSLCNNVVKVRIRAVWTMRWKLEVLEPSLYFTADVLCQWKYYCLIYFMRVIIFSFPISFNNNTNNNNILHTKYRVFQRNWDWPIFPRRTRRFCSRLFSSHFWL